MLNKNSIRILFLALSLAFTACQKDKLDNVQINLIPKDIDLTPSAVRIIDLYGLNHVKANGDSLTNFSPPVTGEVFRFPATAYFPGDGRFGNHWWSDNNIDGKVGAIWTIPKKLFKQDGSIDLEFYNLTPSGGIDEFSAYSIKNSDTPKDHYVSPFHTYGYGGSSYFVEVPRETSVPKEGHFKVRLLNLSAPVSTPVAAYGQLEDLTGPMTLTYADGSPVDAKTNAVAIGKASEYVEIPYGTYQFRALTQTNKIVPGTSGNMTYRTIDPATSSIAISRFEPSDVIYSSIQTFQPGGIYTIVITPMSFEYFRNELGYKYMLKQNAITVIADVPEPINTSLFRVQGFNAAPDKKIRFSANGKEIGSTVAFAQSTSYSSFTPSEQSFEIKDENGTVLDKLTYIARPNENYTLWSYPDPQGQIKIGLTVNNLSALKPIAGIEADGTYGYTKNSFPTDFRFVNLCPDIPYLSVTADDGQPLGEKGNKAVYNLQPGSFTTTAPYIRTTFKQLMAYRSAPGVIPGTWAEDIPVLHGSDLIANKNLYQRIGKVLPPYEPGIYTIALIGRTGPNVPNSQKARLVILKHNK